MYKCLDVVYNSQRDNKNRPGWSCNVTALAMALNYNSGINVSDDYLWEMANGKWGQGIANEILFKDGKITPDENWIVERLEKNRLNEIWYVMEKLSDKVIGAPGYSRFGVNWMSINDIKTELDIGYPVMCTGKFTGAGHIVLAVGYDDHTECLICHDPYGDWRTGYKDYNGEYVRYSYDDLRCLLKGQDGHYWNMKVHADKRVKCWP